jgi:hypothetical protein
LRQALDVEREMICTVVATGAEIVRLHTFDIPPIPSLADKSAIERPINSY